MLGEIPVRGARPPLEVVILRAVGFGGLAVIVWSTLATEPRPALSGRGLGVLAALLVVVGAVALTFPRRSLPYGARAAGLLAVAVAGAVLAGLQPNGAGIGTAYFVLGVSAVRLHSRAGLVVTVVAVAGQTLATALSGGDLGASVGLTFALVPFYLVFRLLRVVREERDRAEGLVEELRASRAAHAQAAALGERARMARELHDVLAHSLSALSLQLEGTRLLAVDRGSDADVVAGLDRAHHLAADGLDEARRAVAALRGDALPGPEGLRALADAFEEHSNVPCTISVTGTPRELAPDARLTLYRTAQESLTNVRRHSAADRVELRLTHAPEGTTLVVEDHGPGAPVTVGASPGGGYGLTGMRERAELLGGRLQAAPTPDGFRVELWLPA